MIKAIKRAVITRVLDKRKKGQAFDLEYADNHNDAGDISQMNNSHYYFFTDFATKECVFYRVAKRGGSAADEIWLTYRDRAGDIYMAASDHVAKGGYMPARVECETAGWVMRFYFDGDVVKAEKGERGYVPAAGGKKLKLKLDGKFVGTGDCFEFSYDMSSKPMAIALSKEKIDKQKLKEFENNHQIHYEQPGKAFVTIELDGKASEINGAPAFRDHSFGKREWNYFDRYTWIMGVLENGDAINTSFIRYPVLKHLQAGFYIENGQKAVSILKATPVEKIAVPSYGNTPEAFGFDVKYVDGSVKRVDCKAEFICPYMFEGDFNVNEGVAEFTVNGIKGRGITEFSFNKDKSRWGI